MTCERLCWLLRLLLGSCRHACRMHHTYCQRVAFLARTHTHHAIRRDWRCLTDCTDERWNSRGLLTRFRHRYRRCAPNSTWVHVSSRQLGNVLEVSRAASLLWLPPTTGLRLARWTACPRPFLRPCVYY